MSRPTSLVDSAAGAFGFTFDALGRRTTLTRPNGISTTHSYDAGSKLLSLAHQGAAVLDGAAYGYDANGNRTQRTDLRTQTVDRKPGGNLGTSMISKSQEETEVSWHLEEKTLEAGVRRLS